MSVHTQDFLQTYTCEGAMSCLCHVTHWDESCGGRAATRRTVPKLPRTVSAVCARFFCVCQVFLCVPVVLCQ